MWLPTVDVERQTILLVADCKGLLGTGQLIVGVMGRSMWTFGKIFTFFGMV